MNFWTATGDVGFSCAGQIMIVDTEVDIAITLSRVHADGPEAPATTTFVGHLKVGDSLFEVDFMTGTTTEIFASWQGDPISLQDVAGWLGLSLPTIPAALNLTLTSLSFAYNFDLSEFVLMASSADSEYYKNAKAVFLFISHESATPFAFNMAIDVEINLSNLPLVGSELQSLQTIDIKNISVLIASGQFTKQDVTQLNTLITTYAVGYPTLPVAGVEAGISLNVPFNFGGKPLPAPVPVVPAVTPGAPPTVTPPADSTFWVNVQKSFGPVTFKRVGVLYQDEQLCFKLDASLAFGGLGLTLNGLAVSSPLSTFSPSFHLDGLGAAFVEGPLEIAGAFLSEPVDPSLCTDANDCYEYAGGVTIMFEDFGFAAIGSYAKLGSFASLFVFGEMDFPLGGIPAFFVTGLNGGFGYNSSLRIPGINEVYQFPFVAGLTNPDVLGGQGGNPPTPLDVLNVLERGTNPWVKPMAGQDWLAAGISFTTYELVDSRALLVAEFGRTFELALIGLATMQLPKGLAENSPEVFVYVELQLEAVFIPDEGFIGLSATLSPNSFLLDKNCHPTGGFALYVWFLGDHAGDFTLSIGGYHPSFTVPAWYPKVARVGFNWPVTKEITITGQAYCALTPAMIMAGGLLSANYQDGNLKAWFTAQADFLISWLPFYYQASIGVSVGASYKLSVCGIHKTLSAEIGATLDLWGPRTGGQVKVQWSVISFTVSFGPAKNLATAPLDWNDFEQNLLPAADSWLTLAINSGLLGIDNDSQPDESIWIVRPSRVSFTANSAIPASAVALTNPAAASLPAATSGISIQPMSKTNVASMITIEVRRNGATFDMSNWEITVRTANVPVALWGAPVAPPTSLKSVISQLASQSARNINAPPTTNELVGFSVAGPAPTLASSTAAMAINTLGAEPIADPKPMPLAPTGQPLTTTLPTEQATMVETIMQTVNDATVAQTRTAIYDALQSLYQGINNPQAFPDTNGSLATLAAEAGGIYTDPPLAQ
jgi:hypothetical protein